jgi:hypothetical protein
MPIAARSDLRRKRIDDQGARRQLSAELPSLSSIVRPDYAPDVIALDDPLMFVAGRPSLP